MIMPINAPINKVDGPLYRATSEKPLSCLLNPALGRARFAPDHSTHSIPIGIQCLKWSGVGGRTKMGIRDVKSNQLKTEEQHDRND